MSRIALGLILVFLVGCPKPVRLQLSVPQVATARASSRLVKGEKPPTPDQCAVPCEVSVAPGTTAQVTVQAPGYYPASFEVSYETVAMSVRGEAAALVVPLYPRPPKPAPAAEPVEAGLLDVPERP